MRAAFKVLQHSPATPDKRIGDLLVDTGRLDPADVERILEFQAREQLRFGEAGIRMRLLTTADVMFALFRQFDFPYLQPESPRVLSGEVVAAYEPFSAEGERMRGLTGQLRMRWLDDSPQRGGLAVIGANRGDGRSALAANLAVTFSQQGERTLLIDGDMRAPRQHQLFGLPNLAGLSTLLSGRSHEQVVQPISGLPGLAVVTAGPVPPNPSELLRKRLFEHVFTQIRPGFDVVIFDTPALSAGNDALLLARYAGSALAVARTHQTRLKPFNDMLGIMGEAGVHLVGSVLVNTAPGKTRSKERPSRPWWRRSSG